MREKIFPLRRLLTFCAEHTPAVLMVAIGFTGWVAAVVRRYLCLGYDDWDLAFFTQGMYFLLRGEQYIPMFDLNFFGNHANFIVYLFLPLFYLFPHPLTLLVLKLSFFFAGALIFYVLAKDILGRRLAMLATFLYIFYPPNIFVLAYEFDVETLSIPFLFLMFLFFRRDNWPAFAVTAFLLIITKENLPLIVCAMGIYGLFAKKDKLRWGVVPIIFSLVSFYLLTSKVVPYFSGQNKHLYVNSYSYLGGSLPEIMGTIVNHPISTFKILFNEDNRLFLHQIFSPLLFYSLLSPHIVFIASPIMLQHMLSQWGHEHTIYFQYTSSIAPFIFIAFAQSIAFVRRWVRPVIFGIIMSLVVLMTVWNFVLEWPVMRMRLYYRDDGLNKVRWETLQRIPTKAPVISTFDFLAELSLRPEVYSFHKTYDVKYQEPGAEFVIPQHVNLALVDFTDRWMARYDRELPDYLPNKLQKFFNGEWQVAFAAESLFVLKRGEGYGKLISPGIPALEIDPRKVRVNVNDEVELVGFEKMQIDDRESGVLPLKWYWKALRDATADYFMEVSIWQGGKMIRQTQHQIGYSVYPTRGWKKDAALTEQYWLHIPGAAQEDLDVYIAFYDQDQNKQRLIAATPDGKKHELADRLLFTVNYTGAK